MKNFFFLIFDAFSLDLFFYGGGRREYFNPQQNNSKNHPLKNVNQI